MTRLRTLLASAGAAAVALSLMIAGPAQAAGEPADAGTLSVQERIDATLAEFPGGVQISWNEIAWDGGDTVLTVAGDPAGISAGADSLSAAVPAAALANCESGRYCAFGGASFSGSKLSFTSCPGTSSTSALGGPVRSVVNAKATAAVRGQSGSTVLVTLAAYTSRATVPAGITSLRCG